MITWHTEKRKLSDLIEWGRNPRQLSKHDAEHIKRSLEKFGVADPLVVNTDNLIIGGHQRKRILQMIAEADPNYEVDVRIPDRTLTDEEVAELNIRLNKNSGSWDWDVLANEFEAMELLDWGFTEEELTGLDFGYQEEVEDAEPQIDKAEELREKWGVKTGQLWKLGEHRLICGDCTDKAVVDRVMGEEKATLLFTDPPYGVDIGAKNRMLNSFQKAGRNLTDIESDTASESDLRDMLLSAFKLAKEYLADDCSVFVCSPQGGSLGLMMMMMMDAGLEIKHVLNWAKNSPTFSLGRLDYEYQHEPILFTWVKTHKRYKRGDFQTSLWHVDKPRHSAEHPTMKPIELPANAILNHTDEGDVVYEPFCGSGTDILACERLSRKCRAIEISPAYCAVSIQRWVDATGGEPELIDG